MVLEDELLCPECGSDHFFNECCALCGYDEEDWGKAELSTDEILVGTEDDFDLE